MRSFTAASLLATALVSSTLSAAQYNIDPESVDASTRSTWCISQQSACPLICTQTTPDNSTATESNDCDPDNLTYSCVCGNGISPNASQYSQTLPYYLCQQTQINCVAACGASSSCAYDCRANHPCGAQDPKRVNVTTTSAGSASATKTAASGESTNSNGAVVYNGLGGSSDASTTAKTTQSNGASTAVQLGKAYGLGAVVAGLFAGFALAL